MKQYEPIEPGRKKKQKEKDSDTVWFVLAIIGILLVFVVIPTAFLLGF